MRTKQPEVTLFSHTKNPIESVALAVSAWTSDDFPTMPIELEDDGINLVDRAQAAFHKTALEYVDTVWVIKNVSRAFQQQLTRTRLASYSIQSMRVVTKNGFASNGHYTMPPNLTESQKIDFHNSMLEIEKQYQKMLADGINVEDARSILPMCIHSDISFRINMNALYHMLMQRFCVNTQWEYRQVARQIKNETKNKLGLIFSERMDAPCVKVGKCPMADEYCGVPIWKYREEFRDDLYNKFVSWKKDGSKWNINWLNDEKPHYIELKNIV